MNKKVSLGATLALIIVAMALTVSVTMVVAMRYFNTNVNDLAKKQVMFDNIADVDTAVRQQYGNIDEQKLRAALAQGYISSVGDPYAAYLSASEYKKAQEIQKGEVTGVGIEATLASDGRIVATLIHKNSAAERAGMQEGDVITAIDGTAVNPSDFAAVESKLESASKIILTAQRGDSTLSFDLTASTYSLVSVQERVIGSVGYLRIRGFHENTAEQFKAAYSALEEQGVTAIVFDLRNNEGGTLQAAQDILSYLMPRGEYAVFTDNSGNVTHLVAEDTHQMTIPSATLVNANTAGEAELFAGVLQEFNMTTVVGEKTAGKGRVQEYFVLKVDSSAVKLSVGELSLSKGGAIQDRGVVPTKAVSLTADQMTNFELLDEKTDPQLITALSTLDGSDGTAAEPAGTTTASTGTTTTASAAATTSGGASSTAG